MSPCPSAGAHYIALFPYSPVQRWGIRKTKKFVEQALEGTRWEIAKMSRAAKKDYHIVFLRPRDSFETMDDRIRSAIEAVASLQYRYTVAFSSPETADAPRKIAVSVPITVKEWPDTYPFRINIFLPPWIHEDKPRGKITFVQMGKNTVPVRWFMKTDMKIKQAIEAELEERLEHTISNTVHESAAALALAKKMKFETIARNLHITVPSQRAPRKSFGANITEFDAVGIKDGKLHIIEAKGVGPRTATAWQRILVQKAITYTPALHHLKSIMESHNSITPHFVVVSTREDVAKRLANAALITLKPSKTFSKLVAHAVWPEGNHLRITSFREPVW